MRSVTTSRLRGAEGYPVCSNCVLISSFCSSSTEVSSSLTLDAVIASWCLTGGSSIRESSSPVVQLDVYLLHGLSVLLMRRTELHTLEFRTAAL